MSRVRAGLMAALALVVLVLTAPTARAQDYPGTTPTTPTVSCLVSITIGAPLVPGGVVSITLGCSSIEAGTTYTGVLQSTPVALPATVAQSDGAVTFANVRLPTDFELGDHHAVSLVAQSSGASLGAATFYVDPTGRITAAPSADTGGLPRTGADYVEPVLRWAGSLLAAGALALLVARRRRAEALPA